MTKCKTRESGLPNSNQLKHIFKSAFFLLVLVGVLSISALVGYAAIDMPAFDPQKLSGNNNTLLYDHDGQLYSSLHAGENRTDVTLAEIPSQLVQAFIATEDREFEHHSGINVLGIARAVFTNVQSGDMTAQGASTITQQLARNSFLSPDKNWVRKIREALLAFKLEAIYSKDEIMEMYLNKIFFGAGAYGVQAAATTYFGKDVSQLNLAESALLAGLVQSPNNYNPFINLDKALDRQKIVLNRMVSSGFIDESTAKLSSEMPLGFANRPNNKTQYGYFVDAVIEEAVQVLAAIPGYEDADIKVYTTGLKIYTTINAPLQTYAEEYFKDTANFPTGSKDGPEIQVGMVILENDSGAVQAIMGGREYLQPRGFNRATSAYRQPGSTIKPITVYSTALENGKMPFTLLNDAPISYKTASGIWEPQNYNKQYRGLISMRTAVKYSVNTYAVQLMDIVGISSGYDNGQSLGLSLVENDRNLAALALGGLTKGVTPLQMAGAYSSFGNTGLFNKPHFIEKIVDSEGLIIYNFQPDPRRVMTEQTSWLMNNMLQAVVESGTGTRAKVPNVPTAGKTGTTDDLTDVWFCGVTPTYAGAVWMGYDEPKNKMVNVAGGGYPALMFKAMMEKAHQSTDTSNWIMPSDITRVSICWDSGKLAEAFCPDDHLTTYYCASQYAPTARCSYHQEAVGELDLSEGDQLDEQIDVQYEENLSEPPIRQKPTGIVPFI